VYSYTTRQVGQSDTDQLELARTSGIVSVSSSSLQRLLHDSQRVHPPSLSATEFTPVASDHRQNHHEIKSDRVRDGVTDSDSVAGLEPGLRVSFVKTNRKIGLLGETPSRYLL